MRRKRGSMFSHSGPPSAARSVSGDRIYSPELNMTRVILARPKRVAQAVRRVLGLPPHGTLVEFRRGNHA